MNHPVCDTWNLYVYLLFALLPYCLMSIPLQLHLIQTWHKGHFSEILHKLKMFNNLKPHWTTSTLTSGVLRGHGGQKCQFSKFFKSDQFIYDLCSSHGLWMTSTLTSEVA